MDEHRGILQYPGGTNIWREFDARAKAEEDFGLTHLGTETLAAYRMAGWEDR